MLIFLQIYIFSFIFSYPFAIPASLHGCNGIFLSYYA